MEMINWLLNSSPYVELATRINILKENPDDLVDLKNKVLSDERIKKYLADVSIFYDKLVTTHKNPELPIHKLIFLFDIGLDTKVPEINMAIQKILGNKDEDGMYKCPTNVPVHYGGTGLDTFGWALCDAPLMLYALMRAGMAYDEHVKQGVEYIIKLHRSNGFPCTVSKELGKWRGPGRKDDPCPYATLIILKLFSLIPEYKDSDLANSCINALLDLWEKSEEQHPYMFYMGKDFRKIKAPTLWYDILSVANCLSEFDYAKKDPRYAEMLSIIEAKADSEKKYTPESVYQKCAEWDFGQKKKPSEWLTYVCLKVLQATQSA